jgi:uncharacterized protein (DUF2236 family)
MTLTETLQSLAMQAIGQRVRSVAGSASTLDDFKIPLGDPGLFGPDSMAWRVHEHFTAMMVGGLSSLMVQALHPRALAAVWDHSDFRHQLKARLGRTAYFVAATTYGGRAQAQKAIERVNAIHANLRGVDQKGRPYVANEPDLIRWVHLVEVVSFLTGFQHLSRTPLSRAECDQYIAEMTRVGHMLGAMDLPATWQGTQDALREYLPVLVFDARAREILQIIRNYPADPLDRPFMALVLQAAFDVTPEWALNLMERTPACAIQQQFVRLGLRVSAEPVQWMLNQQGVAPTARQRVAGFESDRFK